MQEGFTLRHHSVHDSLATSSLEPAGQFAVLMPTEAVSHHLKALIPAIPQSYPQQPVRVPLFPARRLAAALAAEGAVAAAAMAREPK